MKIEYRVGDLLATDSCFICQGCNSMGVMNSGVAKAIRDLYPTVFTVYRAMFEKHGLIMGEVIPVKVEPVPYNYGTRIILNGITQALFGRDNSIVYVCYAAMKDVIRNINNCVVLPETKKLFDYGDDLPTVAFPLIGAGLANGDWRIIASIIEEGSINFKPIVYVQTQAELDNVMMLLAN